MCDTCFDDDEYVQECMDAGKRLVGGIPELETLEIYCRPMHLAFKTEKDPGIEGFMKYAEHGSADSNVQNLGITYKGLNYVLMREDKTNEEYTTYVLVSSNAVDGEKKGLIVLYVETGVLFIATCKPGELRLLNLGMTSHLFTCGPEEMEA